MRDERWSNVVARMGAREQSHKEFEMDIDTSKWLSIEIDVFYCGHHFWSYQSIHKDDIPAFDFDVVSWLLDEMVKRIDDDMERQLGKRNE